MMIGIKAQAQTNHNSLQALRTQHHNMPHLCGYQQRNILHTSSNVQAQNTLCCSPS